jgi:hypothetical protein
MQDPASAVNLLEQAASMLQKYTPLGVASSLLLLGEAHMRNGKPQHAKSNGTRAITIMSQYDERTRERNAPGDLLSMERAQRLVSKAHYVL